MKLFSIASVLAALSLSSAPISAAEWEPVTRSADDTMQVYIETTNLVRDKDSIRVWIRSVVDKPPPRKPPITIQRSTWFKCKTMETALVTLFVYMGKDDTGELLDSKNWPLSPESFTPIRPGSLDETLANFICAKSHKMY